MTLLLRFWKPLAAVAAVLLLWAVLAHREHIAYQRGYQQATSESAKAAAEKQIENAQKEAEDAKRIADAYRARELSEDQLAAIRARPVPSLVCRRAESRRNRVPEAGRPANPETADSGALSRGTRESAEPDFNPVPALIALADEADSLLADCRLLHQSVHGFPTGP